MAQASLCANKAIVSVVSRRIMTNGSWKKTAVGLGLDGLFIYRSEDATKLRSSLPLKSITDLELIHDDEGMPHEFGVRVVYGAGDIEKAVFSFLTKEEAEKWIEELDWRVQAHHRVFKYDDESTSEESATDQERGTRRSKRVKSSANKSKFSLTKKSRTKK